MPVVIVTSSEFSVFEGNMPTAADVQTAMAHYTPRRNVQLGKWVGPAPRITRRNVIGGYETDVAWPYEWPDSDYSTQNLADLKNVLKGQVDQGLNEFSSTFSEPLIQDYSPALHGQLAWWRSGQAAVTQTRDITATGIARVTDTPENPIGPTTPETHPTTVPQAIQGVTAIFKSPWLWVGVGGIALLFAWPYLRPIFLPRHRGAAA